MTSLALQKIVVTGASGFIGRALVAHLATLGHPVVALSRSPADSGGMQEVRLPDYLDVPFLAHLLHDASVVIHLAARAHQTGKGAMQDEALFDDNVQTTQALLAAAGQAGVARFVFISSVGVNGNQTHGAPFTEDDTPAPAEAYARSKLRCEQRVEDAGVPHVIIRPPLVYGAHAPGNFGRLVQAVARGMPLPLGSVHNARSLVALDNLLDFITLCTAHPAAVNQTYLVSDGEDISTTRLLQRTAMASGRPARLLPVPVALLRAGGVLLGRSDTVNRLCGSLQVDISKARRELQWAPPLSVDEGLRRVVMPLKFR
jgi:nucleoside-diphosphate-sugar epimerase